MVRRQFEGQTVVCIGTGPSLTLDDVDVARRKGFVLAGCNNTAFDVPDLAVLYGCNFGWWETYWERVKSHPAEKWTTNKPAATLYGLHWIDEKDAPGLSTSPKVIHHGHGSGYSLLNLVYLMGAAKIVLLGYDMKYSASYDGRNRVIGPTPRHYFGEYPEALQHWPSVSVKGGVHVQLLELYLSVAKQGLVPIVNASRDTALACFPRADIAAVD